MSEPFLEARDLRRGFRSGEGYLPVIQGANLSVSRAEMVAIVGASGVGKSTLLHLLGTLDEPESGTVYIDGQDAFALAETDRSAMRNRTIGFVFQFHHLLPEFSALENVMMPLLVARQPTAKSRERAAELLATLGLAERATHRPGQLSGGEQQRVAVARALVTGPQLLLADEPTGNLDTRTSAELVRLLVRLHKERGLTSVLVTHSEEIAAACDRTVYMEEGQIRPRRS
jgi:lipoprotein-releasing system ATP-binding protein